MTANFSTLVEEFRQKKGLTMQEICGDVISHSSYSRFINKNQALSADKLLYIIDQMDLSFREVGMFDQIIHLTNADKVRMAKTIDSGDSRAMAQLADDFTKKSQREYDTYGMMSIRLKLKMGDKVAQQQTEKLRKYLFQVDHWDYKEMYLFTLIINQMPTSLIQMVVKHTYSRAAAPLYLERNLNLTILLDEAHFEFLKRREFGQAQETLEQLTGLVVNKTFQTVVAFHAISQTLHQSVMKTEPEIINKILRLYRNFLDVQSDYLAIRIKTRYEELKNIYDLPEIAWM